jgi:hypothetical protein
MMDTTTKEAFKIPGPVFVRFFLSFWWVQALVGLIFGHLYSARGIETALLREFEEKRLTSPSYSTSTGTRIGVLVAGINPPSTYLFTNYNDVEKKRTGYSIPEKSHAVKTWEM